MPKKLERTTFETSRVLEFFSEKELAMQMGHYSEQWPVAVTKELIDNALDACEIGRIAPVIHIEIGQDSITVADNGPGLPEETLRASLDYMVRVSDKSYYVSPTRGQLGNALKCVYAAPFIVSGDRGRVQIETAEAVYTIELTLDRLAQVPVLNVQPGPGSGRAGTKVTVWWPDSSGLLSGLGIANSYNAGRIDLYDLVGGYAMFNPHATFHLQCLGSVGAYEATNRAWKHWLPDNLTSPHWYNAEQLRDLIAAYLVADQKTERVRTIREFVAEFRGLASTAKQKAVTEGAGLHGKDLADLLQHGDVSLSLVAGLLSAMRQHSEPVKPYLLGTLSKEHLVQQMTNYCVDADTVRYKRIANKDAALPHLLEIAFGIFIEEHLDKERKIITGLNWAPTLAIPISEFQTMLGEMRIDRRDPVCVVMHVARPRFDFVDRGKGRLDV